MKSIFQSISDAINAELDLNKALELAHVYGNILWFAHVGIYDASPLERNLVARCYEHFKGAFFDASSDLHSSTIHVVTEPYITGGHTRLMEKLALMHDEPVDLLIAMPCQQAAEERVSLYFRHITKIANALPLERVAQTVRVLVGYKNLVLHIHPDDIVTIVACGIVRRLTNIRIYFVNHADHVFTFGSSVASYQFEVSSYGRRLDLRKDLQAEKSFLGIPIEFPTRALVKPYRCSKSDTLLFISAGSDIKFKPVGGLSLVALFRKILDEYPKSTILVIGSNIRTAYWWWWLKLKYSKRFLVKSSLPYNDYLDAVEKADFYIDSHPIPGGTAFAEQFLAGRRCIGLISKLQGYSPADNLKSFTEQEVLEKINDYQADVGLIDAIVDVHSTDNVKKRYLSFFNEGKVSANVLDDYCSWTGDVDFFRSKKEKLYIDIALTTFLDLCRLQPQLAMRLFLQLGFFKKVKLLLKVFSKVKGLMVNFFLSARHEK